jgi:AraC-like DNA-binding protein
MVQVHNRSLGVVVDRLQAFAGTLFSVEPDHAASAAKDWITSLPEPPSAIENIALAGLLMGVAVRVLDRLHFDRPASTCDCYDLRSAPLQGFAKQSRVDSRSAFAECMEALHQRFLLTHGLAPAHMAARLIREHPHLAWNVADISKRLDISKRRLVSEFHRSFDVSIRDYVHLVRLSRALPEIIEHGAKVEAISLQVGYRSKKDLYRACRLFLRSTPGSLRALNATQRLRLYAQLRSQQSPTRASAKDGPHRRRSAQSR